MNEIHLARYFDQEQRKLITVTVQDYQSYLEEKDKAKIAAFIKNRLSSRYIVPYKFENDEFKSQYKNGFSMMASYCLLIEALQSFINGWGDSNRRSQLAFEEFFKNNAHFQELDGRGKEIYKNVRCGILHQGETANGWKITREGTALYVEKERKLDAVLFGQRLENSLSDYSESLQNSEWDSEVWDNFRTKMRKTLSHCEG